MFGAKILIQLLMCHLHVENEQRKTQNYSRGHVYRLSYT